MQNNRLIFVYNANSGLFNTVSDIAHKITSPETYQCDLCQLTHGYFKIKSKWQAYLKHTGDQFVFLHKDEFTQQYPMQNTDLPAVFIEQETGLQLYLSKQRIESLQSLDELIALLNDQLSA